MLVVDFDAAVGEEQGQAIPVPERVADRHRQRRLHRQLGEQFGQPALQRLHQRLALGLAHRQPLLGGAAADAFLDGIDRGDLGEQFRGRCRLRGLVHGHELAARVREAKCQPDPAAFGALDQRLVGAIAVDLQDAGETRRRVARQWRRSRGR